jgi:hypothetical protein
MAFNRTTAQSARSITKAPVVRAPVGRAPVARKARYGGIQAEQERDPFIGLGTYRVRVLELIEREAINDKQTVALTVEIMAAAEGSVDPESSDGGVVKRFIAFRVMGSGSDAGRKRMKSFMVAAHGCENAAEFDASDPDGFLVDAFLGYECKEYPDGATLVGRIVDVDVTEGNPIKHDGVPTGERYTNYTWHAVPEEEQDAAAE